MNPKQIQPPSKRLPAPLWGDNERKRYMHRALLSSLLSNPAALALGLKTWAACEHKQRSPGGLILSPNQQVSWRGDPGPKDRR